VHLTRPAREQTLLDYPIETFNKVVTSGQFATVHFRNIEGKNLPSMLVAKYRSHAVQMSVLGYAICAAVMTACVDDPSPKLLKLDDLTERARRAVCGGIENVKRKPVFTPSPAAGSAHDPVVVD